MTPLRRACSLLLALSSAVPSAVAQTADCAEVAPTQRAAVQQALLGRESPRSEAGLDALKELSGDPSPLAACLRRFLLMERHRVAEAKRETSCVGLVRICLDRKSSVAFPYTAGDGDASPVRVRFGRITRRLTVAVSGPSTGGKRKMVYYVEPSNRDHELELRLVPGGYTFQLGNGRLVAVNTANDTEVQLEEPLPTAEVERAPPPPEQRNRSFIVSDSEHTQSSAPWYMLGAGSALFVGSLIPGAMAKQTYDDARRRCGGKVRHCPPDAMTQRSKAETLAHVANGFAAVGLVTAGVSAVWLLARDGSAPRRRTENSSLSVTLNAHGWGASWSEHF